MQDPMNMKLKDKLTTHSAIDLSDWRPDCAQAKRRRRHTHHGRQPDHLDHHRLQSDESNGWQADWAQQYDHTYHTGEVLSQSLYM